QPDSWLEDRVPLDHATNPVDGGFDLGVPGLLLDLADPVFLGRAFERDAGALTKGEHLGGTLALDGALEFAEHVGRGKRARILRPPGFLRRRGRRASPLIGRNVR